jgi:hypothetical protein
MGIRLVAEVLDRYQGPDARKLWLLAWAEKANDHTRAGWPARQVLAHRTGRSPSRVSHISDELVAEGVLKRDGGGNRGGPARFILLPLADTGKGALRTHSFDAEDDDAPANPQPQLKGAPSTHPSEPPKGAPSTHPKPEVKGAESTRKGAESRGKGAAPSPLPAETGSLPLIEPSVEQPSEDLPREPTAQTILAGYIDWVRASGGGVTRRTAGALAQSIGDLLQQNIPDKHIRTGLANWHASGLGASNLDSFVNASLNAPTRSRGNQNGQRQPRGGASDDLSSEVYGQGRTRI